MILMPLIIFLLFVLFVLLVFFLRGRPAFKHNPIPPSHKRHIWQMVDTDGQPLELSDYVYIRTRGMKAIALVEEKEYIAVEKNGQTTYYYPLDVVHIYENHYDMPFDIKRGEYVKKLTTDEVQRFKDGVLQSEEL